MSTVAEIKAAIDQLSPQEQDEVKTYLRQRMAEDWNQQLPQDETPPRVREKLAEAAQGCFQPGDRSSISKILT
jgi:hypothetical protein